MSGKKSKLCGDLSGKKTKLCEKWCCASKANQPGFCRIPKPTPKPTTAPSRVPTISPTRPALLRIPVGFVISNTNGITAAELESGQIRDELEAAYTVTAAGVVAGTTITRRTRGLHSSDRRQPLEEMVTFRLERRLEVELVSGRLGQIVDAECPSSAVDNSLCQNVPFASFMVDTSNEDANSEEILEQLGTAMIDSINNGTLQRNLNTIRDANPIVIEEGARPGPTLPPAGAPTVEEEKVGTGRPCAADGQCLSDTCRNGVCMSSNECFPLKHEFGTPFDTDKVNLVFVASAFDTTTNEVWRGEVNNTFAVFESYNMFAQENPQYNAFFVDSDDLAPSFCFFNCVGIDRLLCCNITIARSLSDKCFEAGPTLQTIVIHNDPKYGGAGYTIANIASTLR